MDLAIAALAARQHGIAKLGQLIAAGLDRPAITKRVARGVLHRRYRGVYSVGHRALSREGEWLAATFAVGHGAVLSHVSAAQLWELTRSRSSLIDVVVPRHRRARHPIRVHRTRHLDPRDITTYRGIPVTTIARTLVDLSDVLTAQELANVIHEAAFRGRFSELATRDAMARANGRHNLHVLEEALAIHAAGGAGTRSRAEVAFLALMRPEEPSVNTKLLGFEVDAYWPDERLVVEIDGPGHGRPRAKRDDAQQDRTLRAAGYTVLRFTDGDVYERPGEVKRQTVAALASSRGSRRAA